MIMIDGVLKFEKGKSLTALKNVSGNDIFFLGHFPHRAVMPGVLILEGLAQGALILYQLTLGTLPQNEMPLYGSVNAKFHRPVFPGDQLIYEIEVVKLTSYAGLFKGIAKVDTNIIAKAELALGKRRAAELRGQGPNEA
jgi:3-hydroxyacyl-[acyl-carrier-protein] dehydratase